MNNHRTATRYVICVGNEDAEDLVISKVYRVMPDKKAAAEGFIRVVDESGEDYLYPESLFMPIELPRVVARALASV